MKELFKNENLDNLNKMKDEIQKDNQLFKNVKAYNSGSKVGDKSNGIIDSIVDFFFKK